jgi:HK97 family phage portal protein
MPTTAFKFPQLLKDNQREQAREAIAVISGALNSGKPAIFEAGMDSMRIGIDPKDAQLLESRAFGVEEICRWFRVPPFMVGHSEKSTSWGTGIEQQQIGFLQFTLRPWLTRIEQGINTMLLTPAEQGRYYAEFNVDALLRGDSAARREMYASATQNGWMSRNEVRAKENMPPIDGGDTYTVQSNLIPIDQLGNTP